MALSAVTLGIAYRAGWPLAIFALPVSLLVGAAAGA